MKKFKITVCCKKIENKNGITFYAHWTKKADGENIKVRFTKKAGDAPTKWVVIEVSGDDVFIGNKHEIPELVINGKYDVIKEIPLPKFDSSILETVE